jgi:methionine synthase I (cobalamin-dependent)
MSDNFRHALESEVLVADGAMGTLLVTRGAEPSTAKSSLNLSSPETVSEIHEDYADAGARILTTNTWDGNRIKLREHDWADSLEKINRAGVRLARQAASGEHVFVAGSIGPLGAMVKPYGSLSLSQVRELFEEQLRILLDEGVDLVLLESFSNLLEAAEAVRACRGLSPVVPIVAQMTFFADGRTPFGERSADALRTLVAAGADAAGINCTLGPQETLDVFGAVASQVGAPLSVMPNAGYPTLIRGRNVFNASPDYFREYALEFVDHGASFVGGCWGTSPSTSARWRGRSRGRRGARSRSRSRRHARAGAHIGAGDRRDVSFRAAARVSRRLHGDRGGGTSARRRLPVGDRSHTDAGDGSRYRQRHRQSDGAPAHVVGCRGRADPAGDGTRRGRPVHDIDRKRSIQSDFSALRRSAPLALLSRRRPAEDRGLSLWPLVSEIDTLGLLRIARS